MRRAVWVSVAGAVVAAGLLSLRTGARDSAPVPALPERAAEAAVLLEDERNTIEVFQQVSDSVVFITNLELRRSLFSLNVTEVVRGRGSGFIWDTAGHVVTNFHVVQGGRAFSVTLADGSSHEAVVVGAEPNKDLAVLRIAPPEAGLTPVIPGISANLVVGQKVLAVGNPFGLDQTLTTGVISALGREIPSVVGTTIRDVIQTDASINPGNSGGPLLDSRGGLVGVNTAIYSPSGSSAGIGFAVPVDTVKRIVPQLIRHGFVKRVGLGIRILPDRLGRRLATPGVVVHEVPPGSPAEEAGLRSLEIDRFGNVRRFDVLLQIDEYPLESFDDLYEALEDHEVGDEVSVRFARGRRQHTVTIPLQAIN